jgi:Domain of unknown function (DUF6458)
MTIGAALLLIAVGAILRFAISTVSTHGVDLHTIGDILMIVGVVGLLLWLFVWGPWSRRRSAPRTPPVDDERPVSDGYRDGYHDPYRTERQDGYRPAERSYQDPYSR